MSWNSWFFCWTKVFPFSFPHQPQIKRRLKMRPVVLLSSNLFVCPPATSKNSEGSLEKCIEDAWGISLNYWKNILKCKMLLFGKDSSHISCLSQFQFSKMGSKGRDDLLINLAHLSSVSKLFLTIRRAGNMRLLKFPIFRPVVTI